MQWSRSQNFHKKYLSKAWWGKVPFISGSVINYSHKVPSDLNVPATKVPRTVRADGKDISAQALILLADPAVKSGGSCSEGSTDWLQGSVCVCRQRSLFECAGDWRGSFPWTICLTGCAQNKEGPRMVLVHVGYLVLPVFGSVRNRGMRSFMFSLFFF